MIIIYFTGETTLGRFLAFLLDIVVNPIAPPMHPADGLKGPVRGKTITARRGPEHTLQFNWILIIFMVTHFNIISDISLRS